VDLSGPLPGIVLVVSGAALLALCGVLLAYLKSKK
jgi:hypothetical protein